MVAGRAHATEKPPQPLSCPACGRPFPKKNKVASDRNPYQARIMREIRQAKAAGMTRKEWLEAGRPQPKKE